MRRINTVILGGLLAGLFDITDAFIVFSLKGSKFLSIAQAIAAGILGNDAFRGGIPTFLLGLGLHFAMAVVMALVFYAGARAIPLIRKHLLAFGALYGLGLYGVMNWLVVPMSNFRHGQYPPFPPVPDLMLLNGLFCHVVLVGLTIALFTRKALQSK